MANLQPTVLEGIDLESFIQHLLDNHGPSSTLIVCSSKVAFLEQLQTAISESAQAQQLEQPADQLRTRDESTITEEPRTIAVGSQPHKWTVPTLRLLAAAQTLKLAFCEDVTHLRAFLAAYPYRNLPPDSASTNAKSHASARILALLDPIALHRETSTFSAQGLSRTFSIAVDAAYASGSRLVVAECNGQISQQTDEEQAVSDQNSELGAIAVGNGRSVWAEEVSILNVATKTFGAGERGWVGRTVKLRAIAGRWCDLEKWSKDGL